MKKINNFIILTLVLGLITFSCKKEESKLSENQNFDNYSKNILDKINNFRNTMEGNLKAGGTMHINDAVWNLEALICNDNAYPDSSSRNFVTYKSYYTLAIDGDSLANDREIQAVYQLMLDSANYHLSTISSSMKYLVFCDVELDTIIGSTAYIQALNGYGFNYILGWYENFDADDDWIWGFNQGSCNSSPYTELSDASDEIQYRLNHPEVQTVTNADGYTDYETVEITYENCYNTVSTSFLYYGSNYSYCMENTELTFRLEGAHSLIYNYNDTSNDFDGDIIIYQDEDEGARSNNKDFISIEIADENLVGSLYLHKYKVTYAKPWTASTN